MTDIICVSGVELLMDTWRAPWRQIRTQPSMRMWRDARDARHSLVHTRKHRAS